MKPTFWLLVAVVLGVSTRDVAAAQALASAAKTVVVPEDSKAPAEPAKPTEQPAPDSALQPPPAASDEVRAPDATARTEPAAPARTEVAAARRDPEPRTAADMPHPIHGLYVRGGLGFGGLGNNIVASEEDAAGNNPEATITGMGMTSELSLGGAVSSEWVLGAGLWNSIVFATDYTQIEGTPIPQDLRRPESFTVAGFFGDWHFARELGLHAQGGIGVAVLTSKRFDDEELGSVDNSTVALGPGATLGVGADFWVAQRWALGAMARLTAGAAIDDEEGVRYVHGLVTPSLLMTACYNE